MDRTHVRPSKTESRFKRRSRQVTPVQWPGEARTVSLMQLNCAELQRAHFAATHHFARKGQTAEAANEQAFIDEQNLQMVYLMLLEEGSTNPQARIFASADEAREYLSTDERAYFIAEYLRLQIEQAQKAGLMAHG